MNSVYPNSVGFRLNKDDYPLNVDYKHIKLPKQTIIRIYGLSGVGKGRLSQNISSALNIPNLDTGKIFRSVCYAYLQLNLTEINPINTKTAFENLSIQLRNNQFQVFFGKKELLTSDLKTPQIDLIITTYSKDKDLRKQTYDVILNFIINKTSTACITDARGATEEYIQEAEKIGYKIVRILVDVDFDTKLARYYEETKHSLARQKGRSLIASEREKLYKQLWQVMKNRDEKDLAIAASGQWTLITPDSAIIDTGKYNIADSFHLVLSYINSIFKNA